MSEVYQRYHTVLSFNSFSVGSTPIQISGLLAAPLNSVATGFTPSNFRQGIKVTNDGAQTVYYGPNATVSASNGTPIPAGDYLVDAINGSVVVWVVCPAGGGSLSMEERQ